MDMVIHADINIQALPYPRSCHWEIVCLAKVDRPHQWRHAAGAAADAHFKLGWRGCAAPIATIAEAVTVVVAANAGVTCDAEYHNRRFNGGLGIAGAVLERAGSGASGGDISPGRAYKAAGNHEVASEAKDER